MVEPPPPRNISVLGAGVAGVEDALALLDRTEHTARVTRISPDPMVSLEALTPARAFDVLATAPPLSLPKLAQHHRFDLVADHAQKVWGPYLPRELEQPRTSETMS